MCVRARGRVCACARVCARGVLARARLRALCTCVIQGHKQTYRKGIRRRAWPPGGASATETIRIAIPKDRRSCSAEEHFTRPKSKPVQLTTTEGNLHRGAVERLMLSRKKSASDHKFRNLEICQVTAQLAPPHDPRRKICAFDHGGYWDL